MQVHEPLAYFEKGQQWTYLEGVPSTESLCVKLLNEEKEKYGFVICDNWWRDCETIKITIQANSRWKSWQICNWLF